MLTGDNLSISDAVTIDASMLSNGITIDASGSDTDLNTTENGTRVFTINVGAQPDEIKRVTLRKLKLTGADSGLSGGAISFTTSDFGAPTGFAILSVEDCTIHHNHAGSGAGIAASAGELELTRTIIADNHVATSGGGLWLGSLIRAVTISSAQILNNTARDDGGGLWAQLDRAGNPFVTISDTLVEGNAVGSSTSLFGRGGGIFVDLHGANSVPTLNVSNSMFVDNDASLRGGGVYVEAKFPSNLNFSNSTVALNTAGVVLESGAQGQGGGMWISCDPFEPTGTLMVDIDQTTISGNTAFLEGGGLWLGITPFNGWFDGDIETDLNFVTIHNNFSPDGGGLFSQNDARVSTTTLRNTIVSGNRETSLLSSPANNVSGAIESSSSFNLLGSGGSATLPTTASPRFNIHSDAPGLRPLADNGGRRLPNGDPMLTHKPTYGSEAVDAGDPLITFSTSEFDQRGPGFFRVFNQPVTKANRGPVDIGAVELGAARVLDVIISESSFNQPQHEFSFSEGAYQGAPMTGSGNQLRTVPVGGADSVSIQFSDDMATGGAGALGAGSLMLTGLAFQSVLNPTVFNYDSPTNTATWTFDDPLPANQYLISLATAAADAGGNAVDGEWTNPFSVFTTNLQVSTFPSGDGLAGGQFNFVMTILPGDSERDHDVDGTDFLQWQQWIGGPGRTFEQADFNGDGSTNSSDLTIQDANFGTQLPLHLIYADFDNDADVDEVDLDILLDCYGRSPADHGDGDVDLDSDVDGNDELIWQQQVGLKITWVL